jgi:NADPH2:quinone reductase
VAVHPRPQRDGALAKLTAWNVLPNGRSATFFNLWAGKRFRKDRFRAQLREDLGHVMDQLGQGAISAQIAAPFPLASAAEALRFAEAGGNTGKVVILP